MTAISRVVVGLDVSVSKRSRYEPTSCLGLVLAGKAKFSVSAIYVWFQDEQYVLCSVCTTCACSKLVYLGYVCRVRRCKPIQSIITLTRQEVMNVKNNFTYCNQYNVYFNVSVTSRQANVLSRSSLGLVSVSARSRASASHALPWLSAYMTYQTH